MLIFLAACHLVLVVSFTARILLRDDLSPPARLAWFIVLNVVPYAGVTTYFLFGENDIGHHVRTRHQLIFDEIRALAGPRLGAAGATDALIDGDFRPAFHYAASINGFNPVPGNRAALMPDAEETRRRMIEDIDAATDHVHVLSYIWLDDNTGRAIAEALIRAVARGVTCRAMADGLGSRRMLGSPTWEKMRTAGVHLAASLSLEKPLRTVLTSRIDMRNHRKITVIDGRITYCGSRNAADPEFRIKAKYAPWVDIMLRFEGPVVDQNQLLFMSDWIAATGERIAPPEVTWPAEATGFPALVFGDGPSVRAGATPQLFSILIACARRRITISTPYFVPDATLQEALCAAALRGVRVTLIFPARNDSWVVAAASRSFYRKLLEAGCRIHEFRDGLLHAKTLTIDDRVTVIGSTNLDLRSFDLNYENNILLQDTGLTTEVCVRQADYMAKSVQVGLSDVVRWSPLRRIWNNAVATIGPIL